MHVFYALFIGKEEKSKSKTDNQDSILKDVSQHVEKLRLKLMKKGISKQEIKNAIFTGIKDNEKITKEDFVKIISNAPISLTKEVTDRKSVV